MSRPGGMPYGRARPSWQPALATIQGGMSSLVSNESLESQMPLQQDPLQEDLSSVSSYSISPYVPYANPAYYNNNNHGHHNQAPYSFNNSGPQPQPPVGFQQNQGYYNQSAGFYPNTHNVPAAYPQTLPYYPIEPQPPQQFPGQFQQLGRNPYIPQGPYPIPAQMQPNYAYNPASNINSEYAARFGSAQLHNAGPATNAYYQGSQRPYNQYQAPQFGQGTGNFNQPAGPYNMTSNFAHPQRQPSGPQAWDRDGRNFSTGFGHRDNLNNGPPAGFNPKAKPYTATNKSYTNPSQQEHSADIKTRQSKDSMVQATPTASGRSESRLSHATSSNSVAEARRNSHDSSIQNALTVVGLSSRKSQASIGAYSGVASSMSGSAIPKPRSSATVSGSVEYDTPTRMFSSSKDLVLSASNNRLRNDLRNGPPPAFMSGALAGGEGNNKSGSPASLRPSSGLSRGNDEAEQSRLQDTDPFITRTPQKHDNGALFPLQVRPDFLDSSAAGSVIPGMFANGNNNPSAGNARRPSQHLYTIVSGAANIKPTIEVAFLEYNIPFVTLARTAVPAKNNGLVRISNIPFSVTKQEIIAFIGRNARIIKDQDEPIHIIMERVTSKTMDAFVEFVSNAEAVNCVARFENHRATGRGGRLGERHVDLEVVGQAQLMKELFPKAKNVRWDGTVPYIIPHDPNDIYNSGFQGFISKEELVMLVKHVEAPNRSPFAKDCPQRPYECLISTLLKYPWYMVDYITVGDRDTVFEAAKRLVEVLCMRLATGEENLNIDHRLLKRVQRACFQCPGFSEAQKDDIAFICGLTAQEAEITPLADHWHIFKTIGAKNRIEPDVLEYYQAMIREALDSPNSTSLAERAAQGVPDDHPSIFGTFKVFYPDNIKELSIAEAAVIEWNAIEGVLRSSLISAPFGQRAIMQ